MKSFKKFIVPALTIAAFGALGVGATYALFTDSNKADISITAGKVAVSANVGNLKLYSADYTATTGDIVPGGEDLGAFAATYRYVEQDGKFINGGTATLNAGVLTITNIAPGDKLTGTFDVTNSSNVDIKYRLVFETISTAAEDIELYENLNLYAFGIDINGCHRYATNWSKWTGSTSLSKDFTIAMPITLGNEFQERTCQIRVGVEAVQANAHVVDDGAQVILDNKLFDTLDEAVTRVNYTADSTHKDFVVDLLTDVDVYKPVVFTANDVNVTFDGHGHTITNKYVYQSGDDKDLLRGIRFESADYSKYRPQYTVSNLNVVCDFECFYANDTSDVVLNNCNGVANHTQTSCEITFSENALSASYSATLTVNGGTFQGSKNGACIYNTGGEINLNGVKLVAPTATYCYSPTSSESIGDSIIRITSGTISGEFYNNPNPGYSTFVAKTIITGGTFDHNPTAYVDTTLYDVTENGGVWTVTAK